jgi:DNA-binding SARP family transcriptional activator
LASIATERFRESAHRLLIRIHLEEGNNAEACRAYQAYRSLAKTEFGIAPSLLTDALVAPLAVPQGESVAPA